MFEHLGPTPEVIVDKKRTNYKLYLSLLVLSVFVFTFAFSISKGPGSYAKEMTNVSAQLLVDASDKQVVATTKNFSIFDFVIDVDRPDTSLYKLNISVEGLYDVELLRDLKLFHNGLQLGTINTIDTQGKMYFDLSDYKLSAGQNIFSLFFTNGNSLNNYPLVKFILNKEDVFLISDGHMFSVQGDFPLSSGLVTVLDKGYITASNKYLINDFLVNSGKPQQLASFSLGAVGERADLKEVLISYENLDGKNYENVLFILADGNRPIAQTISDNGQIVFHIDSSIVLDGLNEAVFQLHTSSLPEGVYKFFVDGAKATGVWSGQDIFLADKILLVNIEAKSYFIKIQAADLDEHLSVGWNKLYSFYVSSIGIDEAYLNKITWAIDKQNLDIDGVEIYRNGQPYIADVIIRGDKIIVKTEVTNPLKIISIPTEISLLAKLKNVGDKAKIEAVLLPDKQVWEGDDLIGNIIWSDGENFYNSYKIPYLPLAPSILSN